MFIRSLLLSDVIANHIFIKTYRWHKVSSCPKVFTGGVFRLTSEGSRNRNRTFTFFGGILRHIRTLSAIKWPSTISQPFCLAYSWNIVPKCLRNCPNICLRCLLGINTTWYLQFHLVWLKLWYSLILDSPNYWSSLRESYWPTYRSNRSNLRESPGIELPSLIIWLKILKMPWRWYWERKAARSPVNFIWDTLLRGDRASK